MIMVGGAKPDAAVVIAAGGAGRRMAAALGEARRPDDSKPPGVVRKQYLELLGEPVLVHSLRPFLAHPAIGWAVIALPAEDLADPPSWLTELDPRIRLVAGGAERGDSVRLALEAVPTEAEFVLVHDAARPLITLEVIDRVLAAARAGIGAIAATPVFDTLKEVDDEGRITGTPDRRRFWRAQTPQAFPRRLLLDAAHRAEVAGFQATDDASLVEHYGGTVVVVEGAAENLKVTTPADLAIAEALLLARQGSAAPAGKAVDDDVAPTLIPFRTAADREREAPRVAEHLRAGGLIAYPTETVYGLGCALRPAALERLAALKDRGPEDPFLLLVDGPDSIPSLHWTESALRLAAALWPGPLTLALRSEGGHLPERIQSREGTVAVRSSPHPAVRAILAALGEPVTSTSANRTGSAPALTAAAVREEWEALGRPAELWILDGGPLPPSPPSTIVDCTGPRPRVLREGAVPWYALAEALSPNDSIKEVQ